MPKSHAIAVLISGGLDSDVLLAELSREYGAVWPLYVRQGLAWEETELYWLRKFLSSFRRQPHVITAAFTGKAAQKISRRGDNLQPLTILSLPMDDLYGAHWSTGQGRVPGARSRDQAVYLPGRNMILSVKAAVFAALKNIPTLAMGSLGHNPFSDATPRFYRRWSAVLGLGLGRRLQIVAPYRHLSKVQVIRRGRQWPLQLSFSCIAPNGRNHCGRCNKCAERRRAFIAAGVPDKTLYAKT